MQNQTRKLYKYINDNWQLVEDENFIFNLPIKKEIKTIYKKYIITTVPKWVP